MNFFFITNQIDIALHATNAGVDRIFIDLEIIGKHERQGHLDTLISDHKISDITHIREALPNTAEILTRTNPWHKQSKNEIEQSIEHGTDWLMLPMFKTLHDLDKFINTAQGRAKIIPLVETPEAFQLLPEIARLDGIDEIYIGLNDLHLAFGFSFMFEFLINGMLDNAADILNSAAIPFGFGGVARTNEGLIPGRLVMSEHQRLNSSSVILSRTLHRNARTVESLTKEVNLKEEIQSLKQAQRVSPDQIALNHQQIVSIINEIKQRK